MSRRNSGGREWGRKKQSRNGFWSSSQCVFPLKIQISVERRGCFGLTHLWIKSYKTYPNAPKCLHLQMEFYPQSSHGEGLLPTLSRKRKPNCAFGGLSYEIEPANKKNNVVAEQMRRNRMKFLCAKLQSLIPTSTPKVDRCGLYEEASNYIKKLQEEVFHLRQRRDRLKANECHEKTGEKNREIKVDVGVYGREVVISIIGMTRPKCFGRIIEEIEQHGVDVNMSQLSTSDFFVFLYFHASLKESVKEYNPAMLKHSLERRLSMAY